MKKMVVYSLLMISLLIGCSNELEESNEISAHYYSLNGTYTKVNSVNYSRKEGRDYFNATMKQVSDHYDSELNYIHTKVVEEYYLNDMVFRNRDSGRKSYTLSEPQTMFLPDLDLDEISETPSSDYTIVHIELTEDEQKQLEEHVTKLVDEYPY